MEPHPQLGQLQRPLFGAPDPPPVEEPPPAGEARADPLAAVESVLGARLTGTIRRTFDLIEIAEEEIEAAKRRHPSDADTIHSAFRVLCPGGLLLTAPEALYRAHAREVIERVRTNAAIEDGTDAECLAALVGMSFVAPLKHDWTAAYFRLFAALFPDEAEQFKDGFLDHETYEGAVDEILTRLRGRLAGPRGCD